MPRTRTDIIHQMILSKKDDIANMALSTSKNDTAKHFKISVGGVECALYEAGHKDRCSPTYIKIRNHEYKRPGKSKKIPVAPTTESEAKIEFWKKLSAKLGTEDVGTVLYKMLELTFTESANRITELEDKNKTLTEQVEGLKKEIEISSQNLKIEKSRYSELLFKMAERHIVTPGEK